MTAPDPRLGEIEARLTEVTNLGQWEATRTNDVVIYAPNGFGAYRLITHADAKQDAEFIAAAPADIRYLLAELRKAQDALGRVEGLCDAADRYGDYHVIQSDTIRAALKGKS